MINMGEKAGAVMCRVLTDEAKQNADLVVLTSDSRGSGSLVPFATALPKQIVEVGIAEQDLVTISAGLAHSGKRTFAVSPASFLTMRSIEQVKVDVTYSNANVKLIGISGGNSYSVLGSTHHSLQDLAITRALPNLEVYMPSDQYQTAALFKYLAHSDVPAYVRIGKKQLPDIYTNEAEAFVKPGKANVIRQGKDIALIAAGETVQTALDTADELAKVGVSATVVDLVSVKPLDTTLIDQLCSDYPALITIEEHSVINGIGTAVAERVAANGNTKLKIVGFPDEPAIAGTQAEVFKYYGIDGVDVAKQAVNMLS